MKNESRHLALLNARSEATEQNEDLMHTKLSSLKMLAINLVVCAEDNGHLMSFSESQLLQQEKDSENKCLSDARGMEVF